MQLKSLGLMDREDSWTPYKEALRWRRLFWLSLLLNLALSGALLYCTR